MRKYRKSDINKLAMAITHNSELFGDEVSGVIAQLTELSNTANTYGCRIPGVVNTYWGESVEVEAIPDTFKDSWEF